MRVFRKQFNEATKLEALELLQPVTPTDNDHQAHWYDNSEGQRIMAAQNNFIEVFKNKFLLCKNKEEVKILIEKNHNPDWPLIREFSSLDFNSTIYKEWEKMFSSFVNFLNILN